MRTVKKTQKRNRDPVAVGPPTNPKTHSEAIARDAIVAFGAEHGALPIPVERRIARFIRHDYLYAIGGLDAVGRTLSTVEYFDPCVNVWSFAASMTTHVKGHSVPCRRVHHGACVLGGIVYVVCGADDERFLPTMCYDPSTNVW